MNQRIYNYSIHLLAKQDYSEFKLRQKLRSKKDNLPHEIEEVIEALKACGHIKEAHYRRLFIRKWALKGESEVKIRKRAAQEKLEIDLEEFKMISSELGITQDNTIEKLIQKKMRSKPIPTTHADKLKLQLKILRFLISKGHQYDDCQRVLRNFFQ